MLLPNAKYAFINERKLIDYCLNLEHPVGKHKAKVFEAALGISEGIAFVLKDAILNAILEEDAIFQKEISFGKLYRVDFQMTYLDKTAKVRTGWIVRNDELFPRLTTCYVIKF